MNRDWRCPNEVALLMRSLESLEGARGMNVAKGLRGEAPSGVAKGIGVGICGGC